MIIPSPDDLAADTLEGVAAIAAYLGKSERQTYYLLERELLPAFQLGTRWHMRRTTYRSHIERLEAAKDGFPTAA